MERHLRKLEITDEFVKIAFVEGDQIASTSENLEEEEGDKVIEDTYNVKSPRRPHKDLTDAMKKLRKLGLEALEINLADVKDVHQWDVLALDIAGNVTMQKSRVVMTLGKRIKATGKVSKIKTGQITMYPDAEDKVKFPYVDKLTPMIETAITEALAYLDGKMDEDGKQFALFPEREAQHA
jgi:hypothetical protein